MPDYNGMLAPVCRGCKAGENLVDWFSDCGLDSGSGGAEDVGTCCTGMYSRCGRLSGSNATRCCTTSTPTGESDCDSRVLTATSVAATRSYLPLPPSCLNGTRMDGAVTCGWFYLNEAGATPTAGDLPGQQCSCQQTGVQPLPAPGSYRLVIGGVYAFWACKKGSFCPGGVGEATPTECPFGTVCPRGSSEPHSCSGHLCLSRGLTMWSDCPAGRYCTGDRSWVPTDESVLAAMTEQEMLDLAAPLCPAGFYCEVNTATPLPCGVGFVCPLGSARPQVPPVGTFAAEEGQAEGTPCPAGTWSDDDQSTYVGVGSYPAGRSSCTGSCPNASWLWKSGQTSCVPSDAFIAVVVVPIGLCILFTIALCALRHRHVGQQRVKADAERQKRMCEFTESQRAQSAAALAASHSAALALCDSVGQVRRDVAARLSKDVLQSLLVFPSHAALLAELQSLRAGGAEEPRTTVASVVEQRFLHLLQSAISRALVECELDPSCRLLSLVSLNHHKLLLLLPDLHMFCRVGVLTAAGQGFGQYMRQVADAAHAAGPAAAVAAVGEPPCAADVWSAVQREARQFAAAWIAARVPTVSFALARPPPLEQLQQLVPVEWALACSDSMAPPPPPPQQQQPHSPSAAAGSAAAAASQPRAALPLVDPSAPLVPADEYTAPALMPLSPLHPSLSPLSPLPAAPYAALSSPSPSAPPPWRVYGGNGVSTAPSAPVGSGVASAPPLGGGSPASPASQQQQQEEQSLALGHVRLHFAPGGGGGGGGGAGGEREEGEPGAGGV